MYPTHRRVASVFPSGVSGNIEQQNDSWECFISISGSSVATLNLALIVAEPVFSWKGSEVECAVLKTLLTWASNDSFLYSAHICLVSLCSIAVPFSLPSHSRSFTWLTSTVSSIGHSVVRFNRHFIPLSHAVGLLLVAYVWTETKGAADVSVVDVGSVSQCVLRREYGDEANSNSPLISGENSNGRESAGPQAFLQR